MQNRFGTQRQVCRYCGRSSNHTTLKTTGEYGQYYSCIDVDGCLDYQEGITNRAKLEVRRRAEQDAEKERKKEITRQGLYDRNSDLIDKFLQITERKVSIIDDYGDENVEALPHETLICLKKIGQREKANVDWKHYAKHSYGVPEEYVWLRDKLEEVFWAYHEKVKSKTSGEYDLNNMSGEEFETWLVKLLRENGFDDLRGTPKTGDQGADIIARRKGRIVVIQAKRHKGTVGNKAVQEVIGAMHYYEADEGWVVTNSLFTSSAIELAQKSKVQLIDGKGLSRLQDFINEY
jgi:restriction system protein